MFKSSKKSKTDDTGKKIEEKVSSDFITHNMPGSNRFSGQTYSALNPKREKSGLGVSNVNVASHHKIGLLIIGGGLILIGALFYFGYAYFIKPYLSPSAPVVTKVDKTVPEKETPVQNITPVAKVPEIITTNEPVISTSTTSTPSSTEVILPEERPAITAPVVVSTVDSDADGLTDAEEKIVGTDPNKADTDNDGYLDLAELKSGYDPLVPGKKISETSKMLNYQIDSKASVMYPAAWDTTKSETNNTVVFADADKAFIQVVYQDNPERTVPAIWFAQQFPGSTSGEIISGQTWQGFYSQDGLAAYVFNKDLSKIYSFTCSPLTSDTTSVTVFHLMIKTLLIK